MSSEKKENMEIPVCPEQKKTAMGVHYVLFKKKHPKNGTYV
jgi:hypothetical protein